LPPNDPIRAVPSSQEKREALEAVLASDTFARSEQLRSFLRFVCEMEISGQAADITEYLIGVQALGRPADFSPLGDSSVQTRAYELRQRLQKYYGVENPRATVRIELPRGTYTPSFAAVSPPDPPQAPCDGAAAPRRSALRWASGWMGGFLAGCVLVSLAALAVVLKIERSGMEPAARQAWSPLITRDPEIVICLGTALHLLVTPFRDAMEQDILRYPAPAELYDLFSRYRDLPKGAQLAMEPAQTSVLLGNVEALAKILATLHGLHAQVRILPETSAPLVALRSRNVVLVASPWYSRSAAMLLEKTPWTTRWDPASRQVALCGQGFDREKWLLPRRGPRGEYQEVFGLVTVLPNDSTPDGPHTIMVFSGITAAGIQGATEFFTSGEGLRNLAERFRKQGLTGWPKAYQVVVRCRSSADWQLLSYAYESHAIISK
jgi:hypothetical protein